MSPVYILTLQQPHFWFADAEAPLSAPLRTVHRNKARDFRTAWSDWLPLRSLHLPRNEVKKQLRRIRWDEGSILTVNELAAHSKVDPYGVVLAVDPVSDVV